VNHLFPIILIILDVLAAAHYGIQGEFGRTGYWLCAAGITACATWGIH
jgi:hypothetical protein